MRALITGATGFIGARLAERLASEAREVVAFGAANTPLECRRRALLEAAGIEVVIGDVSDRRLLARVAASADTVFHLAAAQHESNVPDAYYRQVNVEGTRNVVEACAAGGVGRLVYGSTIGVYGGVCGEGTQHRYGPAAAARLDETSPTRPQNIYGVTKLEAEQVVRSGNGLSWTIARISETYGPGDGRLIKLFRLIEGGVVPLIGGGHNEHHPVYVDDLVDGLIRAGTRAEGVGETFVLAGADVVETRDMLVAIAAALGKPLRSVSLPLTPFMAAAVLCESSCRPLRMSPPWHRRRLDFFVKRFAFSLEKASRLLGYEPTVPFAEGARRTSKWYREMGYLRPESARNGAGAGA